MNILHLKMMASVAASGSLQKSAQQLHRSQSAISMALKKLEQEAGFALFNRDGYRLQLTAHGQQFLRQAEEVLRQHERLDTLSSRLRTGAEPHLTLCFDHTCDARYWFDAITLVQSEFPATELRFEGESQLRALRRINQGEADLAICPWLPLFRQYGEFETLKVSPFQLVVVMHSQLAKENGGVPDNRQQLLGLPMLVPQVLEVGINVDAILKLPSQRRIQTSDVATQRDMLVAGLGWGAIPMHMAAPYLASGELVQIEIPGFVQRVNLEVHIIRSAIRSPGPAAEAIWQAFAEKTVDS
tara:strand:- start:1759 stop:2655 length:897 start_codon:yes stop_codon:yes gene_type:complete